jgi:hypothetical protein
MGKIFVCNGAQIKCSMGDATSILQVLPDRKILLDGQPQGNIMDFQPMSNIKPFGLCKSLANPTVAAATAANYGRLQPMPCIPNTTSPWQNGETALLLKQHPALCKDSKLQCIWGGMIEFIDSGQGKGQGAFPLTKNDIDSEPQVIKCDWMADDEKIKKTSISSRNKVKLSVKTINMKNGSVKLILKDQTEEKLFETSVNISNNEGVSEAFEIKKEWEGKTIKIYYNHGNN